MKEYMKSHIRCLFLVLLAAAVVLGCPCLPPPIEPTYEEAALTPAILERLKKMDGYDIKNYQFILSSRIKLNFVNPRPNDSTWEKEEDKGVIFENILDKTDITLQNKIIGEAKIVQELGDEILLRVYFEEKPNEAKYPAATYFLVFSAKKSDKNAYFQLKYSPGPDTGLLSEDKGTLTYGERTYNVQFDGGAPYLLLRFEQRTIVVESEDTRIIRGRIVKPK